MQYKLAKRAKSSIFLLYIKLKNTNHIWDEFGIFNKEV